MLMLFSQVQKSNAVNMIKCLKYVFPHIAYKREKEVLSYEKNSNVCMYIFC